MTDREIEAEVHRVGVLVREYLEDMASHCDDAGHEDMRVHTWMVGAIVNATDSDGDRREIVSAAYESSSRVIQRGLTVQLADLTRAI